MRKLIAVLCFMFAVSPLALAQDKAKDATKKAAPAAEKSAKGKKEPSAKQKAQREKMKKCSAEAKAKGIKKKDERNKFMSGCLKG